MKPWREIAVPHQDVLAGAFQQAEFAADITAVHTGHAPREYQDAVAFFERTFITEGMSLLLTQVAQRLVGKGGEPVIQLQTAFGGGKTHTMLAVYHLTTRKCALSDLAGVSALVDRAGLMDVPQARVAVLDGTARSPGQAWKRGQQTIKTLWGELAWQLGGEAAGALVGDADATGTSPGKPELGPAIAKPRAFHASAEVPTSTAKMRFVQIADEIVSVLTSDPNALVRLVVEISAEFPEGASDTVKRAVSENARSLELKNAAWE